MRGCLAVLLRMGILAVIVGILGSAAVLAYAALPAGTVDGWLASIGINTDKGDAFLDADELVYDFTLAADVPRIYYLSIPRLGLTAPVVAVGSRVETIDGQQVSQPYVPHAFAAGWSDLSAPIGAGGNTVFVGHNNVYGQVFKDIGSLSAGDEIIVTTGNGERRYYVEQVVSFSESDQSLEQRLANARWMSAGQGEQLTLITCWPYTTNTHRLVVVARP
ncbi:MAG: sortase [Candidatus Promineifilaceae bacterium]